MSGAHAGGSHAALLLTTGSLAGMYGRRLFYVFGLVIFTGAALLCRLAGSTLMLQLSRGAAGRRRGDHVLRVAGAAGRIVCRPVLAVVITMTQVAETRVPDARRPDCAGFVASGINSTFRQVGIATGIALLGTLFSNDVSSEVRARVPKVPGLAGRGSQIAAAVQSGRSKELIGQLPGHVREAVAVITKGAFTAGLNQILLVAAIIALGSGVISLAAIRSRDFVVQRGPLRDDPGT